MIWVAHGKLYLTDVFFFCSSVIDISYVSQIVNKIVLDQQWMAQKMILKFLNKANKFYSNKVLSSFFNEFQTFVCNLSLFIP